MSTSWRTPREVRRKLERKKSVLSSFVRACAIYGWQAGWIASLGGVPAAF